MIIDPEPGNCSGKKLELSLPKQYMYNSSDSTDKYLEVVKPKDNITTERGT
jgi:hypothetical protein